MAGRREALSQQRKRAPVAAWGHAVASARLARALDVGDDEVTSFTHRFHSYPARLHPLTARRALAALELPEKARVLDPFCGSGTVLVEAVRAGMTASGLDASPLAVLVARAKSGRPRRGLAGDARAIRDAVIAEGKAARREGYEARPERKLGPEQREALNGAFDPHVRRELEALLRAVGQDDLLRACLSSVIIKVSRRASDSRAETVKRAVARGMAARLFADRAEELARGLEALWKEAPPGTPAPDVRLGDARKLPAEADSFDAVVTSPPYAGTYDYADHHKLRLAFLGLPPYAAPEIGARSKAGGDWEGDYARVLAELARVCAGPIVLVIGDSLAGTRAVFADETIRRLAPAAGLEVVAGASVPRLALGRVEREVFAQAPKREHVILLTRTESGPPRRPRRSPSA
jgi:SAM-dependent methyltransferase